LPNLLAEADACALIEKLTAHALRVFAEQGLGGKGAVMPGVGKSAEDFAYDILVQYLTGKIKNRDVPYLFTALRNDILDKLKSAAHKTTDHLPSGPQPDPDDGKTKSLDGFQSWQPRMDDVVCEKSYEERARNLVAGEPDLRELVEAVLDLDLHKPAEIAEALGTTAAEIQARKKRAKRRLMVLNNQEVPHEKQESK
jgi:DNA-directed RNA polymerase specialized sigma24 family protein